MQDDPQIPENIDLLPRQEAAPAPRKRPKPGERRVQILQALAEMLEQPRGEKITTAALATRLGVSEAALYRHFASKAQMFEGLIEFVEQSIFGLINHIMTRNEDGLSQVRAILLMLLAFAEKNRGMTRVLIGDALVNEDDRLQERINQLIERVEVSIKQGLRVAGTQRPAMAANCEPGMRAALLVSYVIGRWQRYAKSGFRRSPTEGAEMQIKTLLT